MANPVFSSARLWLALLVAVLCLSQFATLAAAPNPDRVAVRFTLCHNGGGRDCLVDGDTFWFAGDKYRIADIDTPETHPARCAEEAALGDAATGRLRQWLNAGAFTLESAGRDVDRYGRKLRIVTRGGESVGSMLVAEGLARPWEGRRTLDAECRGLIVSGRSPQRFVHRAASE